jgi:trk system potassium uptake protein TrkH
MLRLLQVFFRATAMPPHAVATPTLSGRTLEREDIEPVLLLLVLFFAAAAVSWLAFVAWGYPPLESLFEVISALGTVGLSTGIARPELEPVLKLVLCADMFLGRLELIALLVLLYPRTWIGKRT